MTLEFTKMHGLGNDFIIVDSVRNANSFDGPAISRSVNDRRFGIGGDGLILIEKGEKAPFRMRMFNPDGSEAEMCGNGIRCVARFIHDEGLSSEASIPIETGAGLLTLELVGDLVRVNMGKERHLRRDIPMAGDPAVPAVGFDLEFANRRFKASAISMGNPHCILFVDNVDGVPVEDWGPQIENHEMFPSRINAHFVEVVSPTELRMRTWERGAGATLACGTGACSVGVAAELAGVSGNDVLIHLPGGDLRIEIAEDRTVFMTGPAAYVFQGEFDI
ncbi:MAG: diaminopimelate epimerase [Armatimonadota bacterium]|nr:diaminopimelate epimerase [Armatimonadota bacterium]